MGLSGRAPASASSSSAALGARPSRARVASAARLRVAAPDAAISRSSAVVGRASAGGGAGASVHIGWFQAATEAHSEASAPSAHRARAPQVLRAAVGGGWAVQRMAHFSTPRRSPRRVSVSAMWPDPNFTLAGVLHLLPLPGAPRGGGGLAEARDRALRDAEALVRGGMRFAILENLGDAPFRAERVDPHVVAAMTLIGAAVNARFGAELRLGVNVLRNDAFSALGVACALGAALVRVNVHIGATWTDQGLIQGHAHDTLRYRRELGDAPRGDRGVRIFADVLVKHGVPAGDHDIRRVAEETFHRGGADGLIVTGAGTGKPTDLDDVRRVRDAVPEAPVWIGSGITPERLAEARGVAHGAIIGTWLHEDGRLDRPLDADRVRRMIEA